jgi:hypothetical protein
MTQQKVLKSMQGFNGRMIMAMRKASDDLLTKKLNEGMMILVGCGLATFDSAKTGTNARVRALKAGETFDGPGIVIDVEQATWGMLHAWINEAFDEVCLAGINTRLHVYNIDDDPELESQGIIGITASFSYMPQELYWLIEAEEGAPLLTVAKKLKDAWLPDDDEEEDDGEDE